MAGRKIRGEAAVAAAAVKLHGKQVGGVEVEMEMG